MYWLSCLIVINNCTRLSRIPWFVRASRSIIDIELIGETLPNHDILRQLSSIINCFIIPSFIISEFVFQWISAIFTQEHGEKRGFIYAWAEYYLHGWMALSMSRPSYVGSNLQVTWEVLGQWKGRKDKRRLQPPELWKKRKISLVLFKTSHKQIVPRTARKCTNLCKYHDDLSHKSFFAWWRHFTTTTRILQDFAFVSKLEVLLFKTG